MKTLRKLLFLSLAFTVAASCNMKDKGNYDYIDRDDFFPVKIMDFEEVVQAQDIVPFGPLYLEPEFEKEFDYDRYTYEWFVTYKDELNGGSVARKDIADTRILDIEELMLSPGTYELYLSVRDIEYDLMTFRKCEMKVLSSPIGSYGVYILKEDGNGNTEVDYFKFNRATELPDPVPHYKDLVSSVMNEVIPGKPVDIMRFTDTYSWEQKKEDGSTTTARIAGGCWYVLSEDDIVAFNLDFTIPYKRFDGHFYVVPQVKPQTMTRNRNYSSFIMNDNQVFSIYTMMANVGRYSMNDRVDRVHVSTAGILCGAGNAMVFDEISGDFLYCAGLGASIFNASQLIKEETELPNKELITERLVEPIAMLNGAGVLPSNSPMLGTSVLKHKTENEFYLARTRSANSNSVPFSWIRPIDAAADIIKTPYPVMQSGFLGDVIYYAKGSELWMYTDRGDTETPAPLDQRQKRVATLGAGETIVAIEPAIFNSGSSVNNFSWVTVTTNTSDGKYKFYAFNNVGTTSDLETTPALTVTGDGRAARSFIYLQSQQR